MPDTVTDSQVGAGSGDVAATAAVVTDPIVPTDSSDAGAASEPDFDFEALRNEMAALSETTATKTDIESLRRAAGHIPGVMSRLDAIEKSSKQATDPRVDTILEKLNLLIDGAAPLLPDEVTSKLRTPEKGLTEADVVKAVEDRLAAVAAEEDAKKGTKQELDPETAREATIMDAQWAAAGESVKAYATKVGVDIALLKPEDVQKAQVSTFDATHPMGDPIAGARALMKVIDGMKSATGRRADRANDAEGKMPDGGSGSSITLADMDAMSTEQLMKIPREVRDAALKAGV